MYTAADLTNLMDESYLELGRVTRPMGSMRPNVYLTRPKS